MGLGMHRRQLRCQTFVLAMALMCVFVGGRSALGQATITPVVGWENRVIPGTGGRSVRTESWFEYPKLDDSGAMVFGGQLTDSTPFHCYRSPSGELTLIAMHAGQVPGRPLGSVFTSTPSWDSGPFLAGRFVFASGISSNPPPPRGARTGMWFFDSPSTWLEAAFSGTAPFLAEPSSNGWLFSAGSSRLAADGTLYFPAAANWSTQTFWRRGPGGDLASINVDSLLPPHQNGCDNLALIGVANDNRALFTRTWNDCNNGSQQRYRLGLLRADGAFDVLLSHDTGTTAYGAATCDSTGTIVVPVAYNTAASSNEALLVRRSGTTWTEHFREGTQAPGCPPGTVFGNLFQTFYTHHQNMIAQVGGGVVFVTANVRQEGSTSPSNSSDRGLWALLPSGEIRLLARHGHPMGGHLGSLVPNNSPRSFGAVNTVGQFAFDMDLQLGGNVSNLNNRAIFLFDPIGGTRLLVQKGQPFPGAPLPIQGWGDIRGYDDGSRWRTLNSQGRIAVEFGVGEFPPRSVLGIVEPACTRGPQITQSPQSLRVGREEPASLSVIATTQGATTYQWRKNGLSLTDRPGMSGSTTPTLTFASLDTSDAGAYDCVVTNPCGSVTSPPATLSVHGTACEGYWTATSAPPQGRREGIMAYHTATQRMFAYGGFSGAGSGGTADNSLIRTGETWQTSSGCNALPRRSLAAAAYDPVRQRVVMFGGQWGGLLLSPSVFEWDGTCFSDRGAPAGPAPRFGHAMAYDPNTGTVILHGGVGASGVESVETWSWNGSAWTLVSVSGPAVTQHAMATDSRRGRVVLFGGTSGGYLSEQTWEWNGASWSLNNTLSRPAARVRTSMTFDDNLGRIVLFGGQGASGDLADTWEFDGADWIRIMADGPAARAGAQIAYDATRRRVVLMGGQGGTNDPFHETWEWRHEPTGGSFTQPRDRSACAGDAATFTVGVSSPQSTYRWQWNAPNGWLDVVEGLNVLPNGEAAFAASQTTTSTLSVLPPAQRWGEASRGLTFRCVMSNSCGTAVSNTATLNVCVADFNCDGTGDFFDYLDFVAAWDAESPAADVNADGTIDFFDYLDFVAEFDLGC